MAPATHCTATCGINPLFSSFFREWDTSAWKIIVIAHLELINGGGRQKYGRQRNLEGIFGTILVSLVEIGLIGPCLKFKQKAKASKGNRRNHFR